MKIIKYVKKNDGKYKVNLEDGSSITLYEDTIIKNDLLYKKEIDSELMNNLISSDNISALFNKCVKYIGVRIRSKKEIRDYLKKSTNDNNIIDDIICKLEKNNLLNDREFARAFVNDKFKFSSMGPYRIKAELKNNLIDDEIIDEYIYSIKDEDIDTKICKFIDKSIKSNRKKNNIRNKIYNNLINNGYSVEMILRNFNNYNF